MPGTTRDVIEQRGRHGRAPTSAARHRRDVRRERGSAARSSCWSAAQRAIAQADLLVLVLDGQQGLVPGDLEIVAALRASRQAGSRCAINKIDDTQARDGALQFYELGFDPLFEVSRRARQRRRRSARRRSSSAGQAAGRVGAAHDEHDGRPRRAAATPRTRSASPSSAGRTRASRRWSTGCCARSG